MINLSLCPHIQLSIYHYVPIFYGESMCTMSAILNKQNIAIEDIVIHVNLQEKIKYPDDRTFAIFFVTNVSLSKWNKKD